MAMATENVGSLRIVVVEDDEDLRDGILVPELAERGFHAVGVGSAGELYRRMLAERYDIVLLDLGLPDEDGFKVAQYLRATSPVGIIMLTGRNKMPDRVRGLADGADAYLAKPVDAELLAATVLSLARRLTMSGRVDTAPGWRLDTDGWTLLAPNGRMVELTGNERCLVQRLLEAEGQPVHRETLIAEIADDAFEFDPHRLEMMVYRLRRKILAETDLTPPLRAVRGKGYRFMRSTPEAS